MVTHELSSTKSMLLEIFIILYYKSTKHSVVATDHPSHQVYRVLVLLSVQVQWNVPPRVMEPPPGTSCSQVSLKFMFIFQQTLRCN